MCNLRGRVHSPRQETNRRAAAREDEEPGFAGAMLVEVARGVQFKPERRSGKARVQKIERITRLWGVRLADEGDGATRCVVKIQAVIEEARVVRPRARAPDRIALPGDREHGRVERGTRAPTVKLGDFLGGRQTVSEAGRLH